MIEFGKTLREAREQKGYTVSQLAEMTHILPAIIDNLEHEDFSKIVAPIYGRGFVKLYCEAVGLETKPLVDEFMSIYTGARPPVIRMREEGGEDAGAGAEEAPAEAQETVQEAAVEPAAEPDPLDEPPPPAMPLFARGATAARVETSSVRQQDWGAGVGLGKTASVQQQEETAPIDSEEPVRVEKYAKTRDYRLPGYSMTEVPKRYWRFGVLLVAAVAIVALLVAGTRALYRATMEVPKEDGAGALVAEEQQAYDNKGESAGERQQAYDNKQDAAKSKVPRKGVKIPPLYID